MSDNIDLSEENKFKPYWKEFSKGIFVENPVFVLLLGLCPTLGVTSTLAAGLGMGLAATFVLIWSNLFVSLLNNYIPDKVRIPSYIIIIASFVTIVKLIMEAYLPALAASMKVFIPLIVVNCIILGRAEAFAGKNKPLMSVLDAIGIGLGFTLALALLGFLREFFGALRFDFRDFGLSIYTFLKDPDNPVITIGGIEVFKGIKIFTLPAGAFFVMGLILAFINWMKDLFGNKKEV